MIPVPNTELVTEGDSEVTIISYHQGVCKAAKLNKTGFKVWQLIDGKRTICDIVSIVASLDAASQPNLEIIHSDINNFIISLAKEGFVYLKPYTQEE